MASADEFRKIPENFVGGLETNGTYFDDMTKNHQKEVADLLTGKGLDKEEADKFLELLRKIRS